MIGVAVTRKLCQTLPQLQTRPCHTARTLPPALDSPFYHPPSLPPSLPRLCTALPRSGLRTLLLSHNSLAGVPDAVFGLVRLRRLELARCGLADVDGAWFQLTALKVGEGEAAGGRERGRERRGVDGLSIPSGRERGRAGGREGGGNGKCVWVHE